jgi:hypothetical protein
MTSISPEPAVLGTGLVAVGLAVTLSNLGVIELLPTLRLIWPALLILWGVLEVAPALARRAGGTSR